MHPDTHNPSAALEAVTKYGLSRSKAMHIQETNWVVPSSYLHLFNTYYILSWSSDYFQAVLNEGMIERFDTKYQVRYHRTNPAEIAKHKGALMLSFRGLKREYQTVPVVLVSLDKRG